MSSRVHALVELLTKAANAYYNGATLLLDDATFDAKLEELKELAPEHPFLETIGSPPLKDACLLPSPMPSLEKIKPGQSNLARFLAQPTPFVLSEKLDGLSALWCSKAGTLYLRGDGLRGQTIQSVVPHIKGLKMSAVDWIIRGEILLPKSSVKAGQLARSIVNGLVHRHGLDADITLLNQICFVAYQVVSPGGLTRSQQFEWLTAQGFQVPWWERVQAPTIDHCSKRLLSRRDESAFDTDGIVVGLDAVPLPPVVQGPSVKNPKDIVAFKMPMQDQMRETTLREVIWKSSAQGYLIPRLRFDPVEIGGSTIEFCSGHNAKNVVDHSLGPGALIRIRRSGDVIPTLDAILAPADAPSLPPNPETWLWVNETHIHTADMSLEQITSRLHLFVKTLELDGIGPAHCKALVDAGIHGPAALYGATSEHLSSILGPKTGASLYTQFRAVTNNPRITEITLMAASSQMPRGIGETKLTKLLAEIPDPRQWKGALGPIAGWTAESLQSFQEVYSTYETWRLQELSWIPYPLLAKAVVTAPAAARSPSKIVCFTGFRDKVLEAAAQARGISVAATLTSSVTTLVVPDLDGGAPSEKQRKAAERGIEIVNRSEFMRIYLS